MIKRLIFYLLSAIFFIIILFIFFYIGYKLEPKNTDSLADCLARFFLEVIVPILINFIIPAYIFIREEIKGLMEYIHIYYYHYVRPIYKNSIKPTLNKYIFLLNKLLMNIFNIILPIFKKYKEFILLELERPLYLKIFFPLIFFFFLIFFYRNSIYRIIISERVDSISWGIETEIDVYNKKLKKLKSELKNWHKTDKTKRIYFYLLKIKIFITNRKHKSLIKDLEMQKYNLNKLKWYKTKEYEKSLEESHKKVQKLIYVFLITWIFYYYIFKYSFFTTNFGYAPYIDFGGIIPDYIPYRYRGMNNIYDLFYTLTSYFFYLHSSHETLEEAMFSHYVWLFHFFLILEVTSTDRLYWKKPIEIYKFYFSKYPLLVIYLTIKSILYSYYMIFFFKSHETMVTCWNTHEKKIILYYEQTKDWHEANGTTEGCYFNKLPSIEPEPFFYTVNNIDDVIFFIILILKAIDVYKLDAGFDSNTNIAEVLFLSLLLIIINNSTSRHRFFFKIIFIILDIVMTVYKM